MKVFVLMGRDYDWGGVEAICSTQEKAEAQKLKVQTEIDNRQRESVHLSIEEYEVDAPDA